MEFDIFERSQEEIYTDFKRYVRLHKYVEACELAELFMDKWVTRKLMMLDYVEINKEDSKEELKKFDENVINFTKET